MLRQAGPWFLIWALSVRAIVAVRRGNADEAIAFLREALTCIRDLQDRGRIRIHVGPVGRRRGTQERRRVGGANPGRQGCGQRADRRHRGRNWCTTSTVQSEREVRARLGPDQWAGAYAAGRRTSFDALLKDIDHVLREA